MNLSRMFVPALVGSLLGVAASRVPIVRGIPQEAGSVHVYIASFSLFNTKVTLSKNLPGMRVAGISCIPKPTDKLPDQAVCHVATSSN